MVAPQQTSVPVPFCECDVRPSPSSTCFELRSTLRSCLAYGMRSTCGYLGPDGDTCGLWPTIRIPTTTWKRKCLPTGTLVRSLLTVDPSIFSVSAFRLLARRVQWQAQRWRWRCACAGTGCSIRDITDIAREGPIAWGRLGAWWGCAGGARLLFFQTATAPPAYFHPQSWALGTAPLLPTTSLGPSARHILPLRVQYNRDRVGC